MTIYLRAGYLTQEFYWFVAGLLVIAFVGSYIGKLLLNKIPQSSFRKIVLLLVLHRADHVRPFYWPPGSLRTEAVLRPDRDFQDAVPPRAKQVVSLDDLVQRKPMRNERRRIEPAGLHHAY